MPKVLETAEQRSSQGRTRSKLDVLFACLKVVRLLVNLFAAVERLWDMLSKLLGHS